MTVFGREIVSTEAMGELGQNPLGLFCLAHVSVKSAQIMGLAVD
jgi:hypothetical protein